MRQARWLRRKAVQFLLNEATEEVAEPPPNGGCFIATEREAVALISRLCQRSLVAGWVETLEMARHADLEVVPESWDEVSYDSERAEPVDPRYQLTMETHIRWTSSVAAVHVIRKLGGRAPHFVVVWFDPSQSLNEVFEGVLHADIEVARAFEGE